MTGLRRNRGSGSGGATGGNSYRAASGGTGDPASSGFQPYRGPRGNGPGNGGTGSPDPLHPRPGNRKLEYEDDNVTRLPIDGSTLGNRAAQRLARLLQQRSGRGSTRLANTAGTAAYVASLMGSTS
jgi:hypothetical protein